MSWLGVTVAGHRAKDECKLTNFSVRTPTHTSCLLRVSGGTSRVTGLQLENFRRPTGDPESPRSLSPLPPHAPHSLHRLCPYMLNLRTFSAVITRTSLKHEKTDAITSVGKK
ncbi:hypothetical protein E2C01_028334 [Portunus trituberculatus]|uniref:Uncharacterized protein n=1 Tax=Portunus trituberculatus TaxID=210409 RepID=A0A5B7EK68_PORTR|nr:hypothetical protein [Portunus trituberculatus]